MLGIVHRLGLIATGSGGPFDGNHWHPYWFMGPSVLGLFLSLLVVVAAAQHWRRRYGDVASEPDEPTDPSDGDVRPHGLQRPGLPGVAEQPSAAPVLASDVEREEAARRLSVAVGEGRLGVEEGTHRIDRALRARYRHELVVLVADLPADSPPPDRRAASGLFLRTAVAAPVVLAALVVQLLAGLWELWPVAVALLACFPVRSR